MFNLSIFHKAKNIIEQHKYYHGSKNKIQDDYIQPKQQFNHEQNAVVTGAFVTSDKDYAKFFALNSCLSRGHTRLDNHKIYFEKISDNIKPEFYIYTVYEHPDKPFIHDKGTEYYSSSPIKIAESEKYDTAAEIENLGYTIYVLDEPLKSKPDKESGNNFAAHKEMDKAIKEKRYHQVDIAKLIEQQSQLQASMQKNITRN